MIFPKSVAVDEEKIQFKKQEPCACEVKGNRCSGPGVIVMEWASGHPPRGEREARGGGGEFGAVKKRAILMEGRFPTRRPKNKKRNVIEWTPPRPPRQVYSSPKGMWC